MRRVLLVCTFVWITIALPVSAAPIALERVPDALKPWIDWVLHGVETRACPFFHGDPERHVCAWPALLTLDLNAQGGRFQQRWQVDRETWIALPGSERHWPQDVRVDEGAATVVVKDGRPLIKLPPGEHRIDGNFVWKQLPDALQLAPDTGLVGVTVDGRAIPFPNIDGQAQLWLKSDATVASGRAEDRIEMQVYRRIDDEVPMQIRTRLRLDVSGSQRETLLGPVLLDTAIPLSLASPLPARLEPDGKLRLQLRPGQWSIDILARLPGSVESLTVPAIPAPWPAGELWSFVAQNHLRVVEIRNLEAVDPTQTTLPPEWHAFPAYRANPGAQMELSVNRRGDPDPAPDQLSLQKVLWLDFDGSGYTVNDTVTGQMNRGWRLEAAAPMQLGRVSADGVPQLITRRPDSEQAGFEVRRGSLNISADSRYDRNASARSATGWSHDFQSVSTTLNLPPGWSLFATRGVDHAPDSWLQRWTLLDLFLVLITAWGAKHLWGWRIGLLALLVVGLGWFEIDAPTTVWLHVIAAIALVRVLPAGRLLEAVRVYYWLALLVLIATTVPYLINQVRTALYPQLEFAAYSPMSQVVVEETALAPPASPAEGEMADPVETLAEPAMEALAPGANKSAPTLAKPAPRVAPQWRDETDPDAKVQTGPGLPDWHWKSATLTWSGPVLADQRFDLYLIPPPLNAVLCLLRVCLTGALVLVMLGLGRRNGASWRLGLAPMICAAAVTTLTWPQPSRADYPDPALLEQLKAKLLEAPACLPTCAQIPRLRIEIAQGQLLARLEVHAAEALAVPLPGQRDQWLPTLITTDGTAAGATRDAAGLLWLRLTPGAHQVMLAGPVPPRDTWQLPLPLKPERVEVKAEGWEVAGLHEDGMVDAQLQFLHSATNATPATGKLEPNVLPPFVAITRTLRLGLDWRVHTRITRSSPPGTAVVAEVPLLAGESVTSADVRTATGKVQVSMSADQNAFEWESTLEKRPELELVAPDTTAWIEHWGLDAGTLWHVEHDGLPVVHHQGEQGHWLPQWRPWPKESLRLRITRPEGVAGNTLTIDHSRLALVPGQRATDATLDLRLRSSQGGQHAIKIPAGAALQSVAINGKPVAVRVQDDGVQLPLVPGIQDVSLRWQEARGIATAFASAPVDLGLPSVNHRIAITLSPDRWTLWTRGPRLGPAVLFWGVLVVILMLAVGLGRARFTPLKTFHWFLLGVGLSQAGIWAGLVVVGWLLALWARGKVNPHLPAWRYDAIQVGIALLTLVALFALVDAIQRGLLGAPDMQIAGNGSTALALHWYQDRSDAILPTAFVASVPVLYYKVLMLFWALWLANALLVWIKWGWQHFTHGGIWRTLQPRTIAPPLPPLESKGNT